MHHVASLALRCRHLGSIMIRLCVTPAFKPPPRNIPRATTTIRCVRWPCRGDQRAVAAARVGGPGRGVLLGRRRSQAAALRPALVASQRLPAHRLRRRRLPARRLGPLLPRAQLFPVRRLPEPPALPPCLRFRRLARFRVRAGLGRLLRLIHLLQWRRHHLLLPLAPCRRLRRLVTGREEKK